MIAAAEQHRNSRTRLSKSSTKLHAGTVQVEWRRTGESGELNHAWCPDKLHEAFE